MQNTLENKPSKMPRVVAYLRVSTNEQAESGAGLDAQLHACRTFADRAGFEWIGHQSDEGIGGATAIERRPALLAALAGLEAGDVFLVAKRDRIGRDPILVAMIESLVGRAGARIVSAAGEGTDGDGPGDILMRRIIDAFAEFERLLIRSRTLSAMESLKRRGRKAGTVPYGWRAVDDGTPSKSGGMAAKLVEDLEELKVIGIIAGLDHSGLSLRQIANYLDAHRIRSRSGRPWSYSSIRAILRRGDRTP